MPVPRKLFFLSLFFVSSLPLLGLSSDWVWQNPLPVGDALGKIQFVSPTEGWIVVSGGKLLHTTNAGALWTVQDIDTTAVISIFNTLPTLSFVNISTGWVLGTSGGLRNPLGPALYKTTNAGVTWTSQNLGTGILGADLQFLSATQGWAGIAQGSFPSHVVGIFKHTRDGGANWDSLTSFPANNVPIGLAMIDTSNGWAIMDSLAPTGQGDLTPPCQIIHTTNGGTTWNQQLVDYTSGLFEGLFMVDLNHGWVVGHKAKILNTTNGGANWNLVTNTGLSSSYRCRTVFFIDANTGWIAADDTLGNHPIVHTTNGGASWTTQNPGISNQVSALYFLDANNGWLAGSGGQISHTTNGGSNWTTQSRSVLYNDLYGVSSAPDEYNVWAVGIFGAIVHTANGGTVWTTQNGNTPRNLKGVCFVDGNNGWAAGDSGTIIHTSNGGGTWSAQASGTASGFQSIFFSNADTGWAVGNGSVYTKTTNGGANWSTPGFISDQQLNSIYFVNTKVGWAVGGSFGANQRIIKSTNGGQTWNPQTSANTSSLNAVFFTDTANGTAVGSSGTILRTTNGGTTWLPQTSGTNNDLFGVSFVNESTGTVVGAGVTILSTTNRGATWTQVFISDQIDGRILGVSFSSAYTGTVVGDGGGILGYRQCSAVPGDVNASGTISIGDAVALVNYIFDKDKPPCLGISPGNCWTPVPICRGDINGNGAITVGDVVYLVNYIFDKDKPPCLGINQGNCWTPVPNGTCCLALP